MKRVFSISLVVAMASLILFLSAIPHHHHGEVVCVVSELCHRDHQVNDMHTGHHDTDNGAEQCLTRHFYISKNVSSDGLASFLYMPLLFPIFCLFAAYVPNRLSKPLYGLFLINPCQKVFVNSSGLRAPPYIF